MVPRTTEHPATAVPSGRRPAVHRRPHRGGHRTSARRRHRLAGPYLLSAGHAVGLPGAGLECGPLLPRRRRPADRPPPGAGAGPVLRTDRRLLPGPPAPARVVLRRRGLLRRPRPGRAGPAPLAVA